MAHKSVREPRWTWIHIWLVAPLLHSAQQTDIHHDCTVMSRDKGDQYKPIRNTLSLGSRAHSGLKNVTIRQYINIEPSCFSDSMIPSFDTPPLPLPEYQLLFIVIVQCNQFQSKASGQSLSSGGHTKVCRWVWREIKLRQRDVSLLSVLCCAKLSTGGL